jgi:hypothetical protein
MYVPITHSPLRAPRAKSVADQAGDGLRLIRLVLTILGWLVVVAVNDGFRSVLRLLRRERQEELEPATVADRTTPALR